MTDNGNIWERVLAVVFLYLTSYTIIKDMYINKLSILKSFWVPFLAAVFTAIVLSIIYYLFIMK